MKGKSWSKALVLIAMLVALSTGVGAQGPDSDGPGVQAALGTTFTYQGHLTDGGVPAEGSYDLQFMLYNAAVGSIQVGSTVTLEDVAVSQGTFAVQLDFGSVFAGAKRYLEVGVRPGASTGSYTVLSPRQELTAAPYALYALSSAPHNHLGQIWTGSTPLVITGTFGSPGYAPLLLANSAVGGAGVRVSSAGDPSNALLSSASNGVEVAGAEGSGLFVGRADVDGVRVNQAGEDGVFVYQAGSPSTHNSATGASGFEVNGAEGDGLFVGRADHDGVSVYSAGQHGVDVTSAVYDGYYVYEPGRDGLRVNHAGEDGVYVGFATRHGVHVDSAGVFAGYFNGNVYVSGSLSKGGGSFQIDHPLEPETKYLRHSFVESPDMMNVYNGNVTTDETGYATVTLPDYFEALNRDFRYQLTVIGIFAQAIIAQEVEDGQFVIQTDLPNVKVSWQVTGIRQDPWAEANRIVVEEEKPAEEQGTYLHPEAYGLPESKGLAYKEAQERAIAPPAQEEAPEQPEIESLQEDR